MRNGWSITIGEGTLHTARLVSCARVVTVIGSEASSWMTPSASCLGNTRLHEYSPTSSGAVKVNSVVSLALSAKSASALPATTAPSGAMTLTTWPRRSHPYAQDTLTFKTTSVPASTSAGGGTVSAAMV